MLVPATKNTKHIKEIEPDLNSRIFAFEILVNAVSTFDESLVKRGDIRPFGGVQSSPREFFPRASFEQIRLYVEIGIHSLKPSVLLFNGLHLADHRLIHPAILRPPFVE